METLILKTGESITIEAARLQDAYLLSKLSSETFTEAYKAYNSAENMSLYLGTHFSVEKIKQELINPAIIYFKLTLNGLLIAYAKLRTTETPDELKDNRPIELERIYVLKKWQNKKIGMHLIKHCISFANKNNYDTLWLGVWEENTRAINFYKSQGFEHFGTHKFIFGNDIQTDPLFKISTL